MPGKFQCFILLLLGSVMLAICGPPRPPVNNTPNWPTDVTVVQGREVILRSDISGLPLPHFHWFKDQVFLTEETNANLRIASMTFDDAGDYYVVATNQFGFITSRVATVSFLPDTTGPDLISGLIWEDGTIEIGFNELMEDYVDIFGVQIYPKQGDPFLDDLFTSSFVQKRDGTGFFLETDIPPEPGLSYHMDINAWAVRDIFGNSNRDIFSFALGRNLFLFWFEATWSYLSDGTDPSPEWMAPGFNDSTWARGQAPLGKTPANPPSSPAHGNIQTPLRAPVEGGPTTVYLRTRFFLPQPARSIIQADLRVVYSGGFVAFLNGQEVARQGVPLNQDFMTFSDNTDEVRDDSFVLPTSVFVDGTNVLAVELHQPSTASSNIFWAASMSIPDSGCSLCTERPVIVNQPLAPAAPVNEGETVTLSVAAVGFPMPTYQWQKDGIDLPGETGTGFTLTQVTEMDSGIYTVLVSNGIAPDAQSVPVVLTVTPDLTKPTLIGGHAHSDGIGITLNFSESLDQSLSEDASHYFITSLDSGERFQVTNVLWNNQMIFLQTEPRPQENYQITLTGLTDSAVAANSLNPDPTIYRLPTEIVVLKTDAEQLWSYLDNGSDQGIAWRNPLFDDSTWSIGPAAHYVGNHPIGNDIPSRTILNRTNSLGDGIITYYFRTTFDFPYDPTTTPVFLQFMIDDGAVFYLNGDEVHRIGMHTTNLIDATTRALRTQGITQNFESPVLIDESHLTSGANSIAVEVHQRSASSSDLAHATRVLAHIPSIPCKPRITSIYLEPNTHELVIEFTTCAESVYLQSTSILTEPSAPSRWTNLLQGPHVSPFRLNIDRNGQQYFRLFSPSM